MQFQIKLQQECVLLLKITNHIKIICFCHRIQPRTKWIGQEHPRTEFCPRLVSSPTEKVKFILHLNILNVRFPIKESGHFCLNWFLSSVGLINKQDTNHELNLLSQFNIFYKNIANKKKNLTFIILFPKIAQLKKCYENKNSKNF